MDAAQHIPGASRPVRSATASRAEPGGPLVYNGTVRTPKSKWGGLLAGGYLLLTLVAVMPLLQDGYVGHGNGVLFLVAAALTAPLSLILLLVDDLFSDVNAFYTTGWPYYVTLFELAAGALMNAAVIYMGVVFIQRRRRHRGGSASAVS
jgi:hypothetical protein